MVLCPHVSQPPRCRPGTPGTLGPVDLPRAVLQRVEDSCDAQMTSAALSEAHQAEKMLKALWALFGEGMHRWGMI